MKQKVSIRPTFMNPNGSTYEPIQPFSSLNELQDDLKKH